MISCKSLNTLLTDFQLPSEILIEAIEKGYLLVDFDARTGHNHGTKFRLRQDKMPTLYEKVKNID